MSHQIYGNRHAVFAGLAKHVWHDEENTGKGGTTCHYGATFLGEDRNLTMIEVFEKEGLFNTRVCLKKQCYIEDGKGGFVPIADHKTVWSDNPNRPLRELGTVSEKFENHQIPEMFASVDTILGTVNGKHISSAGFLGDEGNIVWVLAELPEKVWIKGTSDVHTTYLLFMQAFDGSMSLEIKLTFTRVVCMNTLLAAIGEAQKLAYKIRHTKSMGEKIKSAETQLSGYVQGIKSMDETLNELASRQVTRIDLERIMKRFVKSENPEYKEQDKDGKPIAVSTRMNGILDSILDLYESNDSNAIPEIRGTAYNALNAFIEYADHFRCVKGHQGNAERENFLRAQSAVRGEGAKLKGSALNWILEETIDCPRRSLEKTVIMIDRLGKEVETTVELDHSEIGKGVLADMLAEV